jgi:hypothetical protein
LTLDYPFGACLQNLFHLLVEAVELVVVVVLVDVVEAKLKVISCLSYNQSKSQMLISQLVLVLEDEVDVVELELLVLVVDVVDA